MKWLTLEDNDQLSALVTASAKRPQVIFKFSSICDLSDSIKYRLEKSNIPDDIDFHFLDLIRFRELSNKVAADFEIRHQSPQVLLITDGKCTYSESHTRIRMDAIVAESL